MDKNYKCSVCGTRFSLPTDFAAHKNRLPDHNNAVLQKSPVSGTAQVGINQIGGALSGSFVKNKSVWDTVKDAPSNIAGAVVETAGNVSGIVGGAVMNTVENAVNNLPFSDNVLDEFNGTKTNPDQHDRLESGYQDRMASDRNRTPVDNSAYWDRQARYYEARSAAETPQNPITKEGGSGYEYGSLAPAEPVYVDHSDFIKRVVRHYVGREATGADVEWWNKELNEGRATLNGMHGQIVQSPEAQAFRDKVLTGYDGKFDDTLKQMWKDYVGRDASADELRIHGAAMQNGMTIHEMRMMLDASPEVKNHTAGSPVTADMMNNQNHLMAQAEALADNAGGDETEQFIKDMVQGYAGRPATDADVKWWKDQMISGAETKNSLVRKLQDSPEVQAKQNAYGGEFDKVIDQIWIDYTGGPADAASKKWHGSALKNGMSLDNLREAMMTDAGVQAYVAANPVTGDKIANQNNVLAGVVAAMNPPAAEPAVPATPMGGGAPAQPAEPATPAQPALRSLSGDRAQVNKWYFNYLGREATDQELDMRMGQLQSGVSKNQLLIDIGNSQEAKNFQNSVLDNHTGEFDAVVDKVFTDYAGVAGADDVSKRIHGAALKNGMSLNEFREVMKTSGFVQNHIAGNSVTQDELNHQDALMNHAVQTAKNSGAYKDTAVGVIDPSTGGFSSVNHTALPIAQAQNNFGVN